MLGFPAPGAQREQMFSGVRPPCDGTFQTACLGSSQSWIWPCFQATCMGQLAFLLNERGEKTKTHRWFLCIKFLNYFGETPREGESSHRCGGDLGGSWPTSSSEHVWLWSRERLLSTSHICRLLAGEWNEWCVKTFWAISISLFLTLSHSTKLED